MALPNTVRVLEVSQITPATGVLESAAEFSLPLTFLDTRYLKFPPAERIYYFKIAGLTSEFFRSEILPKLKDSLSHTLLHFLPLAGNLCWPPHSPKPFILYSPKDAVSLTVVESNADFDCFVSDDIRSAADSRHCIPELRMSDSEVPTVALQITLFTDKGFSIAITMHHAAVDGKSVSMFVKSWAHTCRNISTGKTIPLLPELAPCFDRTAVKDTDGLESFYLNHWLASNSEASPRSLKLLQNLAGVEPNLLVRATFRLSRENIEKLRQRVLISHQDHEFQLSTFVLTCSYVSVCLVKARGGDSRRKVYFLMAADCRSRIGNPPISQNYFGNCVFVQDMVLEAGEFMQADGVAFIAKKLGGIIKGLDKGVLQGARESHERLRTAGAEVQKFGVSGFHRFKYYEEDFGWGKPEKVEIPSIDRIKGISLMECRDGNGGVEIGLSTVRQEMEAFASLFVQGLHC